MIDSGRKEQANDHDLTWSKMFSIRADIVDSLMERPEVFPKKKANDSRCHESNED